MNIYFQNIRAINSIQNLDTHLNIWVKDGIIAHCSKDTPTLDIDTRIIDASSMIASPGFIDLHVHLREPGADNKETIQSGLDAASNGGFTSVVCMPNTSPDIDDVTVVEYINSKAKGFLTDVLISAAITKQRTGKSITNMLSLNEAGVVMFTDDGVAVSNSEVMKLAFDYAAPQDLLLAQHCEDHSLTKGFTMNESALSYKLGLKGYPTIAEEIILSRDIMLAEYCGNRRYHAQHISTKGAVDLIRSAKAKGLRVSCEVTPHHFSLSEELLASYDSCYKMNPPLRRDQDIEAIIEGLADGTIDCIATDHAPHSLHEKFVELENAPNGIIGLETAIGVSLTHLVHSGKISINKFIDLFTVNPRNIIGKEQVLIDSGLNANLTIFDLNEEWTVDKTKMKSKSTNTPYHNHKLIGKQKFVFNNNQMIECSL